MIGKHHSILADHWPARRDPGPCFSRRRILRSHRSSRREKLHFCRWQKWRAFCLPTDRTKQKRHHESGAFFAWPARRDSNPRPLESESTAISSFATGGHDVSFEHENHYTPSFRKWQEENARSMKKRAGSVHSRQKAAAAPSGSGGRRLALVLCVAGDERQRRAGLDPIEIPAALSVDGGDHHRVLTGALQRDLPIDVVGHDRGRAVELHRERAAVA